MKPRTYTLSLCARGDANVAALDALRVGRLVVIGKRYDDASGAWLPAAPTTIVADDEAVGHYRKIVAQGHLAPADDATAALVGGRAPALIKKET